MRKIIVVPNNGYASLEFCIDSAKYLTGCGCETCIAAQVSVLFQWLARLVDMSGDTYYSSIVPPDGCVFAYADGTLID